MKSPLSKILAAAALGTAAACGAGPDREPNVGQFSGEAVDSTAQDQVACSSPAPQVFANALCVCGDLKALALLEVENAVGGPASVGVNGNSYVYGRHEVRGNYVAYRGIAGLGTLYVAQNVATAGNLGEIGRLRVQGDVDVGGQLTSFGYLEIGGALRVAGKTQLFGEPSIGSRGPYQAPALPCGCGASQKVNVRAEVAKARDAAVLGRIATLDEVTQTLRSGRYFVEELNGRDKWRIEGAVALYVGGSLELLGDGLFELAPDATLDLFVAGGVREVGMLKFSGAKYASQVRVYAGGDVVAVGAQELHGALYAPDAKVTLLGGTVVRGSIFAGELEALGAVKVQQTKIPLPRVEGSNCTTLEVKTAISP